LKRYNPGHAATGRFHKLKVNHRDQTRKTDLVLEEANKKAATAYQPSQNAYLDHKKLKKKKLPDILAIKSEGPA